MSNLEPSLFGINRSNRDFTRSASWGKNQFNSSFPVALACYMEYKNIKPIYLVCDYKMKVNHNKIEVADIFGMSYKSKHLFFAFERDFIPYQDIVIGTLPRIDLVTLNQENQNTCLRGIEIKLTALPDHTTSGSKTNYYMNSSELTKPRISKNEIKNIILGGGEKLLSPERRFDAIIFNTPGLFD